MVVPRFLLAAQLHGHFLDQLERSKELTALEHPSFRRLAMDPYDGNEVAVSAMHHATCSATWLSLFSHTLLPHPLAGIIEITDCAEVARRRHQASASRAFPIAQLVGTGTTTTSFHEQR